MLNIKRLVGEIYQKYAKNNQTALVLNNKVGYRETKKDGAAAVQRGYVFPRRSWNTVTRETPLSRSGANLERCFTVQLETRQPAPSV